MFQNKVAGKSLKDEGIGKWENCCMRGLQYTCKGSTSNTKMSCDMQSYKFGFGFTAFCML
jgi:hypothetical protein